MAPFRRKSRWQRLSGSFRSALPTGVLGSRDARRAAGGAVGALGGVAGLAALSAAVSSRRRRSE